MPRVFISYRRADARASAHRLHDALSRRVGRGDVFMDVDNIPVGADFVATIREAVGASDVFLAVIGPTWVDATDDSGRRRLEYPDDHVRVEVETALAGRGLVVPVLVDGATMPQPDELPPSLGHLCRRNAVELRHERWHSDVRELLDGALGRRRRALRLAAAAGVLALGGAVAALALRPWAGEAPSNASTTPSATGQTASATGGSTAGGEATQPTATAEDAAGTSSPVEEPPPPSSGAAKPGWPPATAAELARFAEAPQPGRMTYRDRARDLAYSVAVNGFALAVDVRHGEAGAPVRRRWVRYRGSTVEAACIQFSGERIRCGDDASSLGISEASYAELSRAREAFWLRLTRDVEFADLRRAGELTAPRRDAATKTYEVCANADDQTLCVQENGWVTESRLGDDRIVATAFRRGTRSSDFRRPR